MPHACAIFVSFFSFQLTAFFFFFLDTISQPSFRNPSAMRQAHKQSLRFAASETLSCRNLQNKAKKAGSSLPHLYVDCHETYYVWATIAQVYSPAQWGYRIGQTSTLLLTRMITNTTAWLQCKNTSSNSWAATSFEWTDRCGTCYMRSCTIFFSEKCCLYAISISLVRKDTCTRLLGAYGSFCYRRRQNIQVVSAGVALLLKVCYSGLAPCPLGAGFAKIIEFFRGFKRF